MHIHANQTNPNAQLDALQSAQKASAQAEAARTRKKLMESASALAGEAATDAYIVEVESNADSGKDSRRRQKWGRPKAGAAPAESENEDHSVEDWA
jgi:hypothetical protein